MAKKENFKLTKAELKALDDYLNQPEWLKTQIDQQSEGKLVRLDAPIVAPDGEEGSYHELVPSPFPTPFERFAESELLELLIERCSQLTRKRQINVVEVVELLSDGWSQADIASKLGYSREAIRKVVETIKRECIKLGYRPKPKKEDKKGRK